MHTHSHIQHSDGTAMEMLPQQLLALPFGMALVFYVLCVMGSNKKHKSWPIYRTVCWTIGIFFAIISVSGPLAERSHTDFESHMYGHLFLGMLAPLMMVLAAPMTLLLRTVSVPLARRLTKFLRSRALRVLTNPVVASFLNIGGLWLLYTTKLYSLMHDSILLHLFVHIHVFLAGYLFTVSIIYIDPVSHRLSYIYRSIVLVLALAGHGILSKYMYAHPPDGVPREQAETGSMIMYYGGDLIDVLLIFILCLHWFRATRPKQKLAMGPGEALLKQN